MAKRIEFPAGVVGKRIAGGRVDAKRWELRSVAALLGDLVFWGDDDFWEFQPNDDAVPIKDWPHAKTAAELMGAIAAFAAKKGTTS